MVRFSTDNTDGYSAADLAALNAAFDTAIAAAGDVDEGVAESFADHLSERLLAAYDNGLRGDDLAAAARR